jgi:hypothetical protein
MCGWAHGNVFNNADVDCMPVYGLKPRIGRVQVYTAHADPTLVKPDMELNHEVTPKLTTVLGALGHRYSPVRSIRFSVSSLYSSDFIIFVDENHCVFLYENSVWNIKGWYETAMEDDDNMIWMHDNGQDVLCILVVSVLS